MYQPEPGNEWPELFDPAQFSSVCDSQRLTSRERKVLELACRGHGNRRIALQLQISMPTVRSHMRSIYAKLGCPDRVELLLKLIHSIGKCPLTLRNGLGNCPYERRIPSISSL